MQVEKLSPKVVRVCTMVRFRAEQFIQSGLLANPNMPPVYFDFVDNPAINAYATTFEHKKYIGLTGGAVVVFQRLFSRLMSDPRVLSHIGDVSIERTDLPPLSSLPNSAVDWKGPVVLPRDFLRREAFSNHLTYIVLDFLIGHEFTHLVNGHVDYLSTRFGMQVLDEKEISSSEEEALIRQTLEMDADSIAVSHLIGNCIDRIHDPNLTGGPTQLFYQNPADAFLLLYFAISTFFRILGDSNFTQAELLKREYPPTRHRQAMAMSTATTYFTKKAPNLMKVHNDALSRAIREVESAFANIVAGSKSVSGLQTAFGKIGSDHTARLCNFWKNKLRSDLEPFAYHTLPE